MQIIMPDPVPADGVQQFLENVGQLGWIALILVTMGALAGERAAGTVAIVLATPISRNFFVLAKLVSRLALLLVSVLAGAAVCLLYTELLLGAYPLPEFLAATGLYLLYGALVVAWTILMSSLVKSGIGAGGLALVPLFLIPILSLLSGRLGDFLPFGLIIAAGDIVRLRAPLRRTLDRRRSHPRADRRLRPRRPCPHPHHFLLAPPPDLLTLYPGS
ncbi:MAG: ABC transporter permease subunit [Chloroflexota bacterium]|jgi:ABC-2 type transport system permease protein|nr:ABC transporter permease subunit [Chloroflexota bacterium]MDP6756864.1 ABC transporter permease subunit [Chloroflexota bacterium]